VELSGWTLVAAVYSAPSIFDLAGMIPRERE